MGSGDPPPVRSAEVLEPNRSSLRGGGALLAAYRSSVLAAQSFQGHGLRLVRGLAVGDP